jgi:hypothetical protein
VLALPPVPDGGELLPLQASASATTAMDNENMLRIFMIHSSQSVGDHRENVCVMPCC